MCVGFVKRMDRKEEREVGVNQDDQYLKILCAEFQKVLKSVLMGNYESLGVKMSPRYSAG